MTIAQRVQAITSSRRVGIVNDWLTVMGGAELVLQGVHEMMPDVPIYVAQFNPEKLKWLQGKDVRPHWVSKMPLSKSKHYLYAPVLADCYRSFNLEAFDLVFTLSHTFAHHAKGRPDAPYLCYYHSPARSLWFPEVDGRAGSGPLRNQIIKRLKRMDLESSKNPTYLVCNSRTTADRIEHVYRRPVDRIVYPSVDVEKWLDIPRLSDAEGYTMWSRLIPYKKFDLAIQAAKLGGFKLNIVGSGPYESSLKAMAEGMPNVVFHGRLSDADLKSLLSHSRGVLFPAYEDFGIVPVEAMASGLPVVVYDKGGASETVKPEFGVHISQQTPELLAQAVKTLESRTFDADQLKEHAKQFGMERFQREIAESLEMTLERGTERRYLP